MKEDAVVTESWRPLGVCGGFFAERQRPLYWRHDARPAAVGNCSMVQGKKCVLRMECGAVCGPVLAAGPGVGRGLCGLQRAHHLLDREEQRR